MKYKMDRHNNKYIKDVNGGTLVIKDENGKLVTN